MLWLSCVSQRDGRLPWVTLEDDKRVITLSKYGMKVMDDNGEVGQVVHVVA